MKRIAFCVAVAIALVLSAKAQMQPSCPWLTEGSAAALLGGPVKVAVSVDQAGHGSCSFSLQPGLSLPTMEIIAASSPRNPCPPASRKVEVSGTDTLACTSSSAKGESEDRISGRVHAIYFVVTLIHAGMSVSEKAAQQSAFENVAEQVAGALY